MLKCFSVRNFKNFKEKISFDLSEPYNYEFNKEVISNGCVAKSIIYGINSSGKSNMGLALFDLVCHLTDKERLTRSYEYYLNMDEDNNIAEFEYVFQFEGRELKYQYGKTSLDTLVYEALEISGEKVLEYNYQSNDGFVRLEGAETLNNTMKNDSPISRVKYVSSNAILVDNDINRAFQNFMSYVNRMLLFYSLDQRGYQGFSIGAESVAQGIIDSGCLGDFERFLAENNIFYHLQEAEVDGRKAIYCKFKNRSADFFRIASTGTRSLALFYYWYVKMKSTSLVYIDEFDAFYHYDLSRSIVKRIAKLEGVQVILTTHNLNLMSNDLLRPDCYFVLKNNSIRALPELTEKEIRKAHNLQKMYKAGTFDGE